MKRLRHSGYWLTPLSIIGPVFKRFGIVLSRSDTIHRYESEDQLAASKGRRYGLTLNWRRRYIGVYIEDAGIPFLLEVPRTEVSLAANGDGAPEQA